MNKVFLVFMLFATALTAFSDEIPTLPIAVVHKIIGSAQFDGKDLKVGDLIDKNGMLETKEKSLIQIKIAKWGNSISMGPTSKMMLDLAGEKKYIFEEGICRWKTELKNAIKDANKGKLYTKNVSMGVRGTDFLVKRLSLFGESEIIMLDGEVEMSNLEDPKNSIVVKKSQWGGLGGRYGTKIAPPINIPAIAMTSFESAIEAP